MTKVLKDIRESLGLLDEDDGFTPEILTYINGGMTTLYQVGVGDGSEVDADTEWDSVITFPDIYKKVAAQGAVKQYLYLHTKILFDPPPPSTSDHMKRITDELLWRVREICNDEGGMTIESGLRRYDDRRDSGALWD